MQRYPHHWHDGGAGHPWLVLVFVVALVAGIVLLVVAFLRMRRAGGTAAALVGRPATSAAGVDQAIAELRLRYARGDIDREDYLRRAVDLGDHGAVTPPAQPPETPPAQPPVTPPAQPPQA